MTKKERDKLYKIIEIFHNKYYEVNERNISDFYKEIHVMFPTITQNDINWAFEKYLWKKEFKFKKLASILTIKIVCFQLFKQEQVVILCCLSLQVLEF